MTIPIALAVVALLLWAGLLTAAVIHIRSQFPSRKEKARLIAKLEELQRELKTVRNDAFRRQGINPNTGRPL